MEQRTVTTYGIEINSSEIEPLSSSNQASELESLDVLAYEQDIFEDAVVRQVDNALAQKQLGVQTLSIRKEIQGIERQIKERLDDYDRICAQASPLQGHDVYKKNKQASLSRKKEAKENDLKNLEKKLRLAYERLDDVHAGQEPGISGVADEDEEFDKYVRIGEITPFDAVKGKTLKREAPIVADPEPEPSLPYPESSSSWSSDEEYVPEDTPDTEDDGFSNDGEEFHASRRSRTGQQKHSSLDRSEKCKRKQRTRKVEARCSKLILDDGDFKVFRERMRRLYMDRKLDSMRFDDDAQVDEETCDVSLNVAEVARSGDEGEATLGGGFKVPSQIWSKLYRYQQIGVKWMWELHCQEAGGIIGDEMGLGKSVQTIAFLAGLAYSKSTRCTGKVGIGAVLIVCPATIMSQWVGEFHKWWPSFRVAILHDTGTFSGQKATLIRAIHNHPGILLTSYEGLRLNKDELLRYSWHYIILDEGHKIRNPDSRITLACKMFDTPHRLILTGTPMQNNLKELWSLFDFVFPGRLGTLPVFMEEFSVPITLGGYANASAVQVQTAYRCATMLRDTIGPYLLRRLKKDVKMSLDLPPKSEQVLFCKLTEQQVELYKRYINSKDVAAMLSGGMKIFPGLIMLRKICNHPDLAFLPDDSSSVECDPSGLFSSPARNSDNEFGYWKRSGKMIVVEGLLRMWKEQGHRVLLFTQSKQMLDILEMFVKSREYTYLRMDGGTAITSRQPSVKQFNEDSSVFVFLLTTRVGGLGLNLIGANRVLIYDPDWNPSTDAQARERSWRIGQKKDVTIYRLLTSGTIEEKIYHRQIFKQFLTNRILANPMQRRFFKSNDLYELFSFGDVGPHQRTETGAIFAGTGSEIRLKKKPKAPRDEGLPITEGSEQKEQVLAAALTSTSGAVNERQRSEVLSASTSRTRKPKLLPSYTISKASDASLSKSVGLPKNTDSAWTVTEHDKKNGLLDPEETAFEGSAEGRFEINVDVVKLKSPGAAVTCAVRSRKRKKKRHPRVDGVKVDHLDKLEYASAQNADHLDTSRAKCKDEDDILLTLFRSAGVHSALKHDKIEQSGNPDYVLVEKEAERVAKSAVEAVRKSRRECRQSAVGVPTWTGCSGAAGKPADKKPRFGKSIVQTSSEVEPDVKEANDLTCNIGVSPDSLDLSSGSILARMKRRNAHLQLDELHPEQAARLQPDPLESSEQTLLDDIREFMRSRDRYRGRATTQEILNGFRSRIRSHQNALFKELLKQLCNFERKGGGVGVWRLKPEFRN